MSRILTPEAVLSYPAILSPRPLSAKEAAAGKTPKYGCALVFLKGADTAPLKKAAIATAKQKWGDKLAGAKLVTLETEYGPLNFLRSDEITIRLPWRDAAPDVAKKGYPEGSLFLNANTIRRPQVVTLIPDAEGKPSKLEDESKIVPGAIVRASLDPYAYGESGNYGVTFGLGNVQFIRDGDASVIGASSGPAAVDEFSADASAVADLGDLGADGGSDDDLGDLLGG